MSSPNRQSEVPSAQAAAAIAELKVDAGRPLIIVDADEVLFQFMAGFVAFLEARGLSFDWSSFALSGNIHDAKTNRVLEKTDVSEQLTAFFAAHTATMAPVEGAAEALKALSGHAGIVVLSNLPMDCREARISCLKSSGMDYPLIANSGLKGPAVRELAQKTRAPVVFVDDIPHNHSSVAKQAGEVLRIQFISHPKLRPLLGPAEDCHHRLDDWRDIQRVVDKFFQDNKA